MGDTRILFVAPDPAIALGDSHQAGARMLGACKLSFGRDRVFYLSGDMHHYERRAVGPSMHVIAGGGGAFLHGTRIEAGGEKRPAACAYPDGAASRGLVAQVPLKLMFGGAGYLVHMALALIASIDFGAGLWSLFRASSLLVTAGFAYGALRARAPQGGAPGEDPRRDRGAVRARPGGCRGLSRTCSGT